MRPTALALFPVAFGILLFSSPAIRAQAIAPTYGGELRIRAEAFNNLLDLNEKTDDSYQFYRMRYRLWLEAKPRDGLRFYFRFGGESRWGGFEKTGEPPTEAASLRDPESRVSLDNGWAEFRLPVAVPGFKGASFRLGRMDLSYGEGFLIADGTPADGSTSAFFDGMTLNLKGARAQADLFMMKIQDEAFGTAARDENLFGLYTHSGPVDLYLLHRTKWGPTVNGAIPDRPNRPGLSGIDHPRQYTSALGARFAHLPETGWQFAGEAAVQMGRYFDKDCTCQSETSDKRKAFGGLWRIGGVLPASVRPALELGGLYLSGDDPTTGRYEGWDNFYSEWPKYSELLVYTMYDNTTRIRPDDAGTWTNLMASWLELRAKPASFAGIALRVSRLNAPEKISEAGPGGTVRGLLLAGQLNLAMLPGVDGQLLGEWFRPGSFYNRYVQGEVVPGDDAIYGRAQITARF